VDRAAKRLGVSRSEFFARAAERWLAALEDDENTAAINSALAGLPQDTAFTDAAAAALARSSFVDRLCGGPRPRRDPPHPPLHAPSVTAAVQALAPLGSLPEV